MTQPRKPPDLDLEPNEIIDRVWQRLQAGQPRIRQTDGDAAASLAEAADVPDLVVFLGILGNSITQPGTQAEYRLLYLNWALDTWLLVEASGIFNRERIEDSTTTPIVSDAIWVGQDAAVGRGTGSQTVEAQFLTGQFTRAADFEAPPGGSTHDSSTGRFCNARTPLCCYKLSRK